MYYFKKLVVCISCLMAVIVFTIPAVASSEIAIITYDPSGSLISKAEVFLGNELIGKTSPQGFLKFEVSPGEHKIVVSKSGYTTEVKSVRVQEGEFEQIRVEIDKEKSRVSDKGKEPSADKVREKKILFDESHEEWNTTDNSQILVNSLRSDGFLIEKIAEGKITNQKLDNYGIYVVGNAWAEFKTSELEVIENYFNEGGRILLIGLGWSWIDYNSGEKYPMNEVAKKFGASFNTDIIMDPTNHTTDKGSAIFHRPFISSHPITKGVDRIGARGNLIGSIDLSNGWEVLVKGDSDSYSGYHEAPYPQGSNPPVLAVRRDLDSGGKIVILTGDYFIDEHIKEFDNKVLTLNLFKWLAT
ncbi:carboxypeptidase regulatory-like domain-containing protein [Candidatus Bipolaricaulota bacterium]|nr:carboxypeptidase regulatory-like domain-containing protein [Candidatus Bipolaricaulota bacterium]